MIKAAIFDYGNTLHDPETDSLFPGTEALLDFLQKKQIKLAMVSRASNPERRGQDFKRFNFERWFSVMDVVGSEERKEFLKIIREFDVKVEEILVVGDRVKSEILEGNKLGMTTVWVKPNKFKDEMPETEEETPDYTVDSLIELLQNIDTVIP